MKKILMSILITVSFFIPLSISANDNLSTAFNEIINFRKEKRPSLVSSTLKSRNNYYDRKNTYDDNPSTAWSEGVKGEGINEYIYFTVSIQPSPEYENFELNDNYLKIEILIVNGYAKNKNIFLENNRVKKAKIEIYDAPLNVAQVGISISGEPALNSTNIIDLEDTMKPQKFIIKFRPKSDATISSLFKCIGKLTILEVYKGSKYDDTCISELTAQNIK